MIEELCPQGVKYYKLKDIGVFFSGLSGKNKEDFNDGNAKYATYLNIYNNPALSLDITDMVKISDEENQNTLEFGDILFTTSSETPDECGMSSVVNTVPTEKIYLNSFSFGLRLNSLESFDVNYLKHLFRSPQIRKEIFKTANGVTRYNISKKRFELLEIPVPPLELQKIIADYLDKFTDLTAELQAELQGRIQQYDFYRNRLLTYPDKNHEVETSPNGSSTHNSAIAKGEVKWMKINDICLSICSGGTPLTSNREYYNGNIPWLRTQEVNWKDIYDTEVKITQNAINNSSAKLIPKNCVIVAMYGATAAKACINKIALTTNQACCNLQINPEIALYKYVYYWINNNYDNLKSLGEGSQSNLNAQKIKNFLIPVPSLEEQKRIVSILDKFDTLSNNLTKGLPAEIEGTQQRYEYYRDMLLNFNELERRGGGGKIE